MVDRSNWNEKERDLAEEGATGPEARSAKRIWNWFGAAFGLLVFVGASVLYVASRAPAVEAADAAPAGTSAGDDLENHNRLQEPVLMEEAEAAPAGDDGAFPLSSGRALGALMGVFVVDSFGFHEMEETYEEAAEVDDADVGRVARVIIAVDTADWPESLRKVVAAFRVDVVEVHDALQAGDLEAVRHGLEGVHSTQHDLSSAVYDWLAKTMGTDLSQPKTSDSQPEAADTAPTASDTTVSSEKTGGESAGISTDDGVEKIEIEMFEFGYAPDTIDIQAGVPVVIRFTNRGKLPHEAMVGDAHMQEEFAAAGDHDDGQEGGDDHHGNLMATMVQPGETQELEVVIDEAGTWFVACHLVGHYEAGQIATINVEA